MTETEGLIPRPADVIGQLEYEIDKGGNSATVNAMIAAMDELRKVTIERDEWREACLAHGGKAERAERALAEAVAAEREACAQLCEIMQRETTDKHIGTWMHHGTDQIMGRAFAAAIRARSISAP